MKFPVGIGLIVIMLLSLGKVNANGRNNHSNGKLQDHAFTLLLNISEDPKYSDRAVLKSNYKNFVEELRAKKEKWNNDQKTLRYIFYKTHRSFLKQYKPYQSFEELFLSGTYGCLTGTTLYAFLLEELDYKYEIIETNYHMFLMVKVDEKDYLMESTDPIQGFVQGTKEVQKRINEAIALNKDDSRSYAFNYDIYKSVSPTELISLQYYNMAVNSYNQENYALTLYCLNEASRINPSVRISEFLELLKKSMNDQDLFHKTILNFDALTTFIAAN